MNNYFIAAKKYFYIILTYFLFSLSANSQDAAVKHSSVKFETNLQASVLIGQKGSKPALNVNAINGLKFDTWFTGIGVGIDYYGLKRSVPLFVDVKKDLSEKVNTFFLFGDLGYDFPWLMNNQKPPYANNYNAMGGLYYETGLGYKFRIFNASHISFSAGYSFKQLKEKYAQPCFWCENYIPPVERYNYMYRRLSIKFNWWLL